MIDLEWNREAAARAWTQAREGDPGDALTTAGQLLLLGGVPEGFSIGGEPSIADASLEQSAVALLEALDAGDDDGAVRAIEARHAAEARLTAATELSLAIAPEVHEALSIYDDLVRPELWRLVRLNAARDKRASALVPPHRERCWWWSEGVGLDPSAERAMPAVAALVARFGAAHDALGRMIDVARAWSTQPVRTIASWLRAVRGGPLALAAAPSDEVVVLRRADLELSWRPPDVLIVDLLVDPAEGAKPIAFVGEDRIEARAIEGALHRFELTIDISATRAVLEVPLASGVVLVPLPPE